MEYQIISADGRIGQIQVAYKNDGKIVGIYAIDVPIVDGQFIIGADLHTHIMHTAPVWAVEREQEVVVAQNFNDIVSLVQPLEQNEVLQTNSEAEANAQMWEQIAFERRVAATLLKFGVLQTDPTAIEVTQL